MSPNYHLRDADGSQNLNCVTSHACLQKLKKIPYCEMKGAEYEVQGAEHKDQDDNGALCTKRTMCKKAECNRSITRRA